jgi:putative Holliday junction resolvase
MSNYVLALDVGERRIGVALASLTARLPAPLQTIDRIASPDFLGDIKRIIQDNDIATIIVGLPRGLSGQETHQTATTRAFAAELGEHVSVPVIFQDEAGTSYEAEELLKQRGKNYQKADIDAEAACIILRDYLGELTERTA